MTATATRTPLHTQHVPRVTGGAPRIDNRASAGYTTPGEFLRDVQRAAIHSNTPTRLHPLAAAGSDEAGGYADPHGGFLVPESFSPELDLSTAEADPLAGLVKRVTMDAPRVSFPYRSDKDHSGGSVTSLTVSRRGEADTASATRTTRELLTLTGTALFALSYATEELVADSAVTFAETLATDFRDEVGGRVMDERINGTGAGQFTGVLNAGCTISVAKEGAQAATTIVYANAAKMAGRCWRYGSAAWVANQDTLPQLLQMTLTDGRTAAVTAWPGPEGGLALLGRPLILSEFTQTLGTVGDIVLGNWSQYVEGYMQQATAASVHVRYANAEQAFRFMLRCDGAPWWRSALTPRYSATTLSPFIVLAARD